MLERYLAALERVAQPIRAGDLPQTLQPLRDLLSRLGDPQRHIEAIVVAGSVGKGTTAHRLAARMHNAGLFTSPHLHSFRERFQIGGQIIAPDTFTDLVAHLHTQISPGESFSTFEQATALACLWFARESVPVAIFEVGLGGRFDAVNAVPHDIALITPIEMEHAAMLGGTLEQIAWHKAGVIPSGGHALTVSQPESVMRVLRTEAETVQAGLEVVAFDALPDAASDLLRSRGLQLTEQPPAPLTITGRLEVVQPDDRHTLIIDGSHTERGAERLRAKIASLGEAEVSLVIGMLRDKQAAAYLAALDQPGWRWTLTTLPAPRALKAEALQETFTPQWATIDIQPDVVRALADLRSSGSRILVCCGSLRLAALAREQYGLLDPALLEESRRTRQIFEGDSYLRRLR